MSTETNFLIHSWFAGVSLTSKADVQEFIERQDDTIKHSKERMTQLAFMTEPKKFIEDHQDPFMWIQGELDEIFEDFENASWKKYCAECILDQWDTMHHENGGEIRDYDDMNKLPRISAEYGVPVHPDGSPYFYEDEFDMRQYRNLTGHDWPQIYNDHDDTTQS